MELALLARYPFLPQAAEHVANEGPALQDLLQDRIYASARAKGRARVLAALEEAKLPPATLDPASPPRELLEDLLAYVHARILLSALADPYVVRRHALAEALRVRDFLANEEDAAAVAACAAAVDLPVEGQGDAYTTHFTDYLRLAVHLKDHEWKLVRQRMTEGVVEMDLATTARLVQEGLRRRIEGELPKEVSDELVALVEPDLAPLREASTKKKASLPMAAGFGSVELDVIPPCMKALLASLQRGENVAHNGRFAITTFLHKIGMDSEQIMALFAQAPDFREDLTRYQVEHITGKSSGTTYSVPGCDNLQTFNLCLADDLCRTKRRDGEPRVTFPGDYYRYMKEAKPHVDALVATVPLADPVKLVFEAAKNYALLKTIERVAGFPHVQALAPGVAVKAAAAVGLEVKGDALVVPDDPWRLLRFLESEALRTLAARAPPKA